MRKRDNWYLPNSETLEALGPFTHDQISDSIRKGELRIDDFIWNIEFASERWVRLLELADFEPLWAEYPKCKFPKKRSGGTSTIKKVKIKYASDKGNLARENEFRRYPRAPLKASALVHNQLEYQHATIKDISEKGLFLIAGQEDLFNMGEEVIITILDNTFLGTMSIRSVVINSRNAGGNQGYGLYFLHVNPLLRRRIVEYVVKTLNGPIKRDGNDELGVA